MSNDHSEGSDLEKLFLESLASKPKLPKKSADQSALIVRAFLEELLEESPQEPVDEEPQKPLLDRG